MRVGIFCRLLRNSSGLTLRKFSNIINIPYSSISAIENGWLPPSTMTITSLLGYLSIICNENNFKPLSKYLGTIFLQEYSFRLSADNYFYSISWCSSGVLRAFLDLDRINYTQNAGEFIMLIMPEELLPDKKDYLSKQNVDIITNSYIWALVSNDISQHFTLSIDTKFKLILLYLKEMNFVKPEDARHLLLNHPQTRTRKLLDSLLSMPILTRQTYSFINILERVFQNTPDKVPVPYDALSIILTLAERVELNPLNPGEITVYLTSHANKRKKVTSYYPPLENIPEIQLLEPFLKIEETST